MDDATAFGLYEDNLLGVHRGDTVLKLRARQIVVATGSYETPMTFDRNDLPGVMLSTGAQRLTRLYGVKPGSRAVVVTSGDRGYRDAEELLRRRGRGRRRGRLARSRPERAPGRGRRCRRMGSSY